MAHDYFQDVVPPQSASRGSATPQRSIRNITPSGNRPRTSRTINMSGNSRPPSNGSSKKPNYVLWVIIAVVLAIVGFLGSTFFLKTTVTVVPRSQTTVFDAQATYEALPAGAEETTGALVYSTDTKRISKSTAVVATGSEEVTVGSSGTITIYNDFSETSQRLIPNTRFEAPGGLIYRIQGAVVVPGKSGSAPGTITATVYADEAGEEYNIGPVSRFSVPGLKDFPDMYAGIYASSDEPMTGGFVGTRPAISEAAKANAQAQLEEMIRTSLAETYADVSSQYALTSLARIQYSPLSTELASDGSAMATLTADITVPVIARAALDSFLAAENNASAASASIHIRDPSSFSFLASGDEVVLGEDTISFSISGKALFVWDVDTQALAADLAGRNKGAFETIVGGYNAIDTATANIYPIWNSLFPENPEDINITLEEPESSQ